MRRPLVLLAVVGVAAAAGCATPTRFVQAGGPGAVGWSQQPIEQDRYRVSFRAGDGADPRLAQDGALLRAAELTLGEGARWFTVVERGGGPVAPRSPRFSFGVGGANFGRGSAIGGGVSTGVGGLPGAGASLEILISRAPGRPEGPDVYDARDVSDRLRATFPPG